MAVTPWFVLDNVQSIALCLVVFSLLYWYLKKPRNAPPGPMAWPILGNLPSLLVSALFRRELKMEHMMRLYMKHGKIFTIKFGNMVMYVLNDAGAIKEAFQRPEFSRMAFVAMNICSVDEAEGDRIFNGDIWTQHRRFTLSVFQNGGSGSKSSFDSQIADEVTLFGDALENMHGKPFDPKETFMNVISNIIFSVVLERRFDYDDPDFRVLVNMIAKRPKLTAKLSGIRLLPIPFLGNMLSKNYVKEHKDNLNYVHSFIRRIVEDHKKHLEEKNDNKDFIDLYLTESNRDKETNFQEENLVYLIDMMLIAGIEGSAHTLAWCFLHMVANPDIQERIRSELTAACGDDRLPTYSDKSKMPYTEAFLMEVLRLHTTVPLGVPHSATKTTTLEGYTIPEGTIILANLWAVHHDSKLWNDPEEFQPNRFINKDGEITKRVELMPFSTGHRSCLGEKIAEMALFIALTHLVRRFRFTSPVDPSTLTFRGVPEFTYGPPEFNVSATKI